MAALPKRKISKQRKNNRRAHSALEQPTLVKCPKCSTAKRPHFKCDFCGYYGGKVTKAKSEATDK